MGRRPLAEGHCRAPCQATVGSGNLHNVGFVSTSAEVISLKSQQKGRLRVRGDAGVIKGILVKHGLAFPLSYTS